MFGFDEARDAHQQVYGDDGEPERKGKFSHELVAGGAAFEGMKLFEDHQRKEGKTVSHAFAKELLMGFVGGEVDKLAETKGMSEYDRIEAKRRANAGAEQMYDNHYRDTQDYNPNQSDQPNFNY